VSAALEPAEVTVLDLLDRVLDRGVVLSGNLTISVAGVDLLFVDLQLVIAQCVRELGRRDSAEPCLSSPPRLGFGIPPSVRAPARAPKVPS
jgi:Gas vesicle protein